jgi:adenosylhomocysteine nucleosidase
MIAVTFALPSESCDFRRLLHERHPGVAILHTGVGAELCRRRIEPFLDSQRFDFLISSGFAGGVAPSLGVGDLLLAENFSDPELLARAREALISHVGTILTADRIIETAAQREELARQHDAAAVDMETEWIARACAPRKIPLLSLRVISDTAAAPFPLPPAVLFDLERQKTNPGRLAGHLLTHPRSVVRLMRFVRQLAAARRDLAAALEVLIRELR